MDTVAVTIEDLEDVRLTLGACLTYFRALELQQAQVGLTNSRPSPLSLDVEKMYDRYHGYLGDYLLARHEALLEEDDLGDEDDTEGPEKSSETDSTSLQEDEVEDLSADPLGSFKPHRQEGRRLTAKELAEADDGA